MHQNISYAFKQKRKTFTHTFTHIYHPAITLLNKYICIYVSFATEKALYKSFIGYCFLYNI